MGGRAPRGVPAGSQPAAPTTARSTASPAVRTIDPTTAPTRRALTRWLVARTRHLLAPLALAVLARILGHLIGAAVLVVAAAGLVGIASGERVSLTAQALVIVGLSLAKAGLRYLEHYAGHWVAFSALQRLRELLFAKLIPQAPAATTGRASAELTERATRDIDRIEVFFAHTIPPVVASLVVPAVALGWLAVAVSPRLAGIIAVFLAAALLLPFFAARSTWAATRAQLLACGGVATHVSDDIQGLREVLAFEAQSRRLESLAAREADVSRAQRRIGRVVAARGALERVIWGGCLVAVLLSGASGAEVAVALALTFALWLSGSGIDDFATGLDAAFAACDRVRRIVDAPVAVRDTGTRIPEGSAALPVALEGVSFTYPGASEPALSRVSLRFDPGGWHYVTGPSGSGKSTVASLLVRAWDPDSGRILLDGAPLDEFSLDALREAVAVVDQRPVLFPGTVAGNLRLGRPEASEEELRSALRAVGLDAGALADGLETAVGERGTALSGGQLQRVAIARALVSRPRVLVLDEALSQLDADTAAVVRERLSGLGDALTIVEITHRTDVIPDEGRVAVVDRGEVVERGSAGELRARGSAFARLALRG